MSERLPVLRGDPIVRRKQSLCVRDMPQSKEVLIPEHDLTFWPDILGGWWVCNNCDYTMLDSEIVQGEIIAMGETEEVRSNRQGSVPSETRGENSTIQCRSQTKTRIAGVSLPVLSRLALDK